MEAFDRSEHVRPHAVADALPEVDTSDGDRGRRLFIASGATAFVLLLAGVLAFVGQVVQQPEEAAAPPVVQIQREFDQQQWALIVAQIQSVPVDSSQINADSPAPVLALEGNTVMLESSDPWFLGPGLLWLLVPILGILLWPWASPSASRPHRTARE